MASGEASPAQIARHFTRARITSVQPLLESLGDTGSGYGAGGWEVRRLRRPVVSAQYFLSESGCCFFSRNPCDLGQGKERQDGLKSRRIASQFEGALLFG